jgi:hypothetical protein
VEKFKLREKQDATGSSLGTTVTASRFLPDAKQSYHQQIFLPSIATTTQSPSPSSIIPLSLLSYPASLTDLLLSDPALLTSPNTVSATSSIIILRLEGGMVESPMPARHQHLIDFHRRNEEIPQGFHPHIIELHHHPFDQAPSLGLLPHISCLKATISTMALNDWWAYITGTLLKPVLDPPRILPILPFSLFLCT